MVSFNKILRKIALSLFYHDDYKANMIPGTPMFEFCILWLRLQSVNVHFSDFHYHFFFFIMGANKVFELME